MNAASGSILDVLNGEQQEVMHAPEGTFCSCRLSPPQAEPCSPEAIPHPSFLHLNQPLSYASSPFLSPLWQVLGTNVVLTPHIPSITLQVCSPPHRVPLAAILSPEL